MLFTKSEPQITFPLFLEKCKEVKHFNSTSGKRYKVIKIDNELMRFVRLDGKFPDMEWNLNLIKLHQAYTVLDDFSTSNFMPFVPRSHSPARGLLVFLGLLKVTAKS
jgi:hypothetical protein